MIAKNYVYCGHSTNNKNWVHEVIAILCVMKLLCFKLWVKPVNQSNAISATRSTTKAVLTSSTTEPIHLFHVRPTRPCAGKLFKKVRRIVLLHEKLWWVPCDVVFNFSPILAYYDGYWDVRYIRQCAERGEVGPEEGRWCKERTGTFQVKVKYCHCDNKDGCNAASTFSSVTSFLTPLLLVTFFIPWQNLLTWYVLVCCSLLHSILVIFTYSFDSSCGHHVLLTCRRNSSTCTRHSQ